MGEDTSASHFDGNDRLCAYADLRISRDEHSPDSSSAKSECHDNSLAVPPCGRPKMKKAAKKRPQRAYKTTCSKHSVLDTFVKERKKGSGSVSGWRVVSP